MVWILIIRWIIFITFLLLVTEGVAAIVMSRHFYNVYVYRHHELEEDLKAVKRRIDALEGTLI